LCNERVELGGVGIDGLDLAGECALRGRLRRAASVTAVFERAGERLEVSFVPTPLFCQP